MNTVQLVKTFDVVRRRHGKAAAIRAVIKAQQYSIDGAIMADAIRSLARAVYSARGMTEQRIYSSERHLEVSIVRHEVFWRAKRCGFGWREIGRVMRRDHATVIKGARSFQARLDLDQALRARVLGVDADGELAELRGSKRRGPQRAPRVPR